MDAFLNKVNCLPKEDTETIAYVDDVVILIKANSRNALEDKAKASIDILLKWCNTHKLTISATKTIAMLMKGKMSDLKD